MYDTMQNPDQRPRMSPQSGALQTLTTGITSLWSTTYQRVIRVELRIANKNVSKAPTFLFGRNIIFLAASILRHHQTCDFKSPVVKGGHKAIFGFSFPFVPSSNLIQIHI